LVQYVTELLGATANMSAVAERNEMHAVRAAERRPVIARYATKTKGVNLIAAARPIRTPCGMAYLPTRSGTKKSKRISARSMSSICPSTRLSRTGQSNMAGPVSAIARHHSFEVSFRASAARILTVIVAQRQTTLNVFQSSSPAPKGRREIGENKRAAKGGYVKRRGPAVLRIRAEYRDGLVR